MAASPAHRVSTGERLNTAETTGKIQQAVAARGIRMTRQRRVILQVMDDAGNARAARSHPRGLLALRQGPRIRKPLIRATERTDCARLPHEGHGFPHRSRRLLRRVPAENKGITVRLAGGSNGNGAGAQKIDWRGRYRWRSARAIPRVP